MKISTQTAFFSRTFGEEKGIESLCKIGYEALDYSMFSSYKGKSTIESPDYEKKILKLKKIANDYGVFFNQTHAPFPSYKVDDAQYNKKILPLLIRAIEISSILGAKQVIIHPIALKKKQKQFNIDFFNSLTKYAKEYNVKIALENMFGRDVKKHKIIPNVCSFADEFVNYMDELDPRYFTACLDIGHAGLVGESASRMIYELGHDKLTSLHVHDNNNIEDLHTLPFTQALDWNSIMKALKDINYQGELTLEADKFFLGFPVEMAEDVSKFMLKSGKQLIKIYESF